LNLPTLTTPLEEPLEPSTLRVARLAIVGCPLVLLINISYAAMESDLLARGLKIGGCLFWAYTIFKVARILRENRELTKQAKTGLPNPG
jgi:hypothetical protein